MRDRVILVTGAGGFVGGNVAAALTESGAQVLAPPRTGLDLGDARVVADYLRDHNVTMIIHAAGRVGGIAANIADPLAFFVDNLRIGEAVVRAADRVGVPELLNLSSSCVYPRDREQLAEEDLMSGPLEPTNEAYALAKIAVGRICDWACGGRADRAYRTILPCNLYGPGDHFVGSRAHLVASAIAKVAAAARDGATTVDVWGDGQARREFMHVRDLCDAILFLLPRITQLPQYLNVGTGVDYTVDEYYHAVACAFGWGGQLRHDLTRPVGMRRKLLDVRRLAALGWRAEIGLDHGIADTVAWWADHACNQEHTPR
jgi:GDP-L-fucose synthase